MKEAVLYFLSSLEGYHQTLKMLHWSAPSHSLHLLFDDMDKNVLELEDDLAERAMGLLNTKFGIGDLKSMLPNGKNIDSVLSEMEKDTIKLKEIVADDPKYGGIVTMLDDFLGDINKWNYLKTLS